MTRTTHLAPSLLSADFGCMAEATRLVKNAGLRHLHLDVMDGDFVPPITFGAKMAADLRAEAAGLVMIAHLMVARPERYVEEFAAAGADIVEVHAEATVHLHRLLEQVRATGKKAGVALNPATPLDVLDHVMAVTDLILVMTVNPGFGGQSFIRECLPKIEAARRLADAQKGREVWVEVDGGVKLDNVKEVAAAGADIVVAGSAVFGAPDPARAIKNFQQILHS